MSYILDALRKAERERRLARVPTLDTVHTLDKKPRTRVALWLIMLLLVVNVGVLVWAFRWPLPDGAAPEEVPAARVAPGTAPERQAEPVRSAAAPPPGEPRPGRATASSPPAPPTQPVPKPEAPTPSAPTPIPPPPPAPTPPAASPASPPVAPPPVAGLSAPPPAVPLPSPSAAPASPAAPPPVTESAPAREAAAGLREALAGLREAVRGLSLDVLVYADATAQRMVFINGRKYVEGQQVDGKLLVEAITPEGAVLAYEGQRHLLRPRSNPYVR